MLSLSLPLSLSLSPHLRVLPPVLSREQAVAAVLRHEDERHHTHAGLQSGPPCASQLPSSTTSLQVYTYIIIRNLVGHIVNLAIIMVSCHAKPANICINGCDDCGIFIYIVQSSPVLPSGTVRIPALLWISLKPPLNWYTDSYTA